jgi:hypothetical protein
MTKLYQIAIAAIIGLATPTLFTGFNPAPVMAQPEQKLSGVFSDNKWNVGIAYDRNTYRYSANSTGDKTGIDLAGAVVGGTRDRRTYTWNNGGTRYQATWQRKDPDFIRVRVFSPNGKEILNRLLKREEDCC